MDSVVLDPQCGAGFAFLMLGKTRARARLGNWLSHILCLDNVVLVFLLSRGNLSWIH